MKKDAKVELKKLRGKLKRWLKLRKLNDDRGRPDRVFQVRDWALEQRMSDDYYALLSEVMDGRYLPSPRISAQNPDAAVKLAKIIVAGKLPEEVGAAADVGFVWLWPAVAIVGVGALVLMSKIESDADVAIEKERLECIKGGYCTDYGFWIKMAAVVGLGWFAWEKVGLKEKVKRLTK